MLALDQVLRLVLVRHDLFIISDTSSTQGAADTHSRTAALNVRRVRVGCAGLALGRVAVGALAGVVATVEVLASRAASVRQ